jgi:2-polyprenyl-3-methyl-5-hydroxy-6-metoxy-1,4-benzoquinol methylase
MDDMYSSEWFETFAATVPAELTAADVDGIAAIVPVDRYPRLLDVGCGIGRVAAPLAARGYVVTGIDVNVDALTRAARSAPARGMSRSTSGTSGAFAGSSTPRCCCGTASGLPGAAPTSRP